MTSERTLFWYPSFHPQKVRLALNALALPHTLRRVNLLAGEQRTLAFLAMNPMGKVPVLVDDGMALPEASAIIAYLGERYGLWPTGHQARAEALRWLFFEAHSLRDPAGHVWFHRFFMPLVDGPSNADETARGEAELAKPMAILDARLAKSPWMLGTEFSLLDCCYGSVFDAIDLGGFDLTPYPAIADHLARMRALPAWGQGEFWTAADLARKREAAAA